MFDRNSEASFVLNGVFEFIKAWQSGSQSKLTLHSKNGHAWLNFSCRLGGPLEQHQKSRPRKSKSKKKQERDNLRAQLHQQRLNNANSSSNPNRSSIPPPNEDTDTVSAVQSSTNTKMADTAMDTAVQSQNGDFSDSLQDASNESMAASPVFQFSDPQNENQSPEVSEKDTKIGPMENHDDNDREIEKQPTPTPATKLLLGPNIKYRFDGSPVILPLIKK